MEDHPPRRAKLLEFGLAAALIGAVSLFLLDRLATLQEEAEKIRVEATVRDLNSGLLIRQAELMIGGREHETAALVGKNPVEWLPVPLPDDAGPGGCGTPPAPAPGVWCWDAATGRLLYLPRRADGLKVEGGGPLLVWRVAAPAGSAAVRPGTLRVLPEVRYDWRP